MPEQYYNIGGINTYLNPVSQDGALIHAVNVVSFPYGAKSKRSGYSKFLGTPDVNSVNTLLDYHQNDGTTFFLYRASGAVLYYSIQGTGAWTAAGNGVITSGAHVGAAQLDNTFVLGDGAGSTRHTANGTAFTNTPLAPISNQFEQYQNRIYAAGTASDLFYSTTNDGTNWSTTGTADSSSFKVPGAGKLSTIFKCADRLTATKNSREMYKWDGYNLVDMTTRYGPSSPYCVGGAEGYRFLTNQYGIYGFGGNAPELISNAVQRQFYNTSNTGIAGSVFTTIPGKCHVYDYLISVGTFTDNFTNRALTNGVIKYDFQKNEFINWDLADKPTAFLSFTDASGSQQLIFGDGAGQCYKFDNTTTDDGNAIVAEMLFVFNGKVPEYEKKWNWLRMFFNPGCEAKVQVACTNTFTYTGLRWQEVGDVSDGEVEYRFPPDSRSRLLFLKIYESSKSSRFTYYGCSIDFDTQVQR